MDFDDLTIETLSRDHNRAGFSCGVFELDSYLQKDARRHNDLGCNHTVVLVEKGDADIIGFFSYAAASVSRQLFPADQQKKLPNFEIPCFRLTRFGIDEKFQKYGYGAYLLYRALKHAAELSSCIGSYAVVVDAKNEGVKSFYIKHGFYSLSGMLLYLPIKEIKAELSVSK